MQSDRIRVLQRMLERNPDDARARFGLALEYEKLQQWREAAEQLRAYLARADDQGNAWGRLGHALRQLGDEDGARDAYRRGIESARRHGHPAMAAEFEELIGGGDGGGQ
jgi:thioredoxin-like negative regulator of GroEL